MSHSPRALGVVEVNREGRAAHGRLVDRSEGSVMSVDLFIDVKQVSAVAN